MKLVGDTAHIPNMISFESSGDWPHIIDIIHDIWCWGLVIYVKIHITVIILAGVVLITLLEYVASDLTCPSFLSWYSSRLQQLSDAFISTCSEL